jgi:HAD superfamily 5'-nucleotidase-like hydrolase
VQLELPFHDPARGGASPIDAAHRIYVNRDLKLAQVSWVGFDMDYTLAVYHQEAMDRLSIRETARKLIARGYPDWVAELDYPLDFPIRGLLIDKQLGNVLKMNRFKIARRGYHGLCELSREELRSLYYERKLRHKTTRYHWIDTLYGVSEACMYAAIIGAYAERGLPLAFARLFDDIRECIDEAHRDDSIQHPVLADLPRYVERDEQLAVTLHKLRSAGKRLFVLTNSRHDYTEVVMSYLLDGMLPDYPSYRHYFDAIIVAARKPSFFQDRNPLRERRGDQLVRASLPLERGRIYEGGNLRDLQRALGASGDQVLYVGDHVYGDMVRSKKDSAWRTAMVIPELAAEVQAHEACRLDFSRSAELYHRRYELEDRLRQLQQRHKELTRNQNGSGNHAAELGHVKHVLNTVRKQLRALEVEAGELRRRIDDRFHPRWGSLLKEGNELSLFGHQVSEYACVYTSRVSNLLAYSPHQYFRSPYDKLHHEL